jgi:hypothetical protein
VVVVFGPFAVKLFAVAAEARKVLDLAAEVWLRGLGGRPRRGGAAASR